MIGIEKGKPFGKKVFSNFLSFCPRAQLHYTHSLLLSEFLLFSITLILGTYTLKLFGMNFPVCRRISGCREIFRISCRDVEEGFLDYTCTLEITLTLFTVSTSFWKGPPLKIWQILRTMQFPHRMQSPWRHEHTLQNFMHFQASNTDKIGKKNNDKSEYRVFDFCPNFSDLYLLPHLLWLTESLHQKILGESFFVEILRALH